MEIFKGKIKNIMLFPEANPKISNEKIVNPEVRKCLMSNYIIFYLINFELDRIEVVRVLYNKQNYEKIF
ncbi:type II toxin-antitoxin system RelE/ParE family toxin [Mycoplasmatota bacterium]|nr:type II toxin-antitoxin system RelE/ParE family toxin [Mycoplasmatota bacterium]